MRKTVLEKTLRRNTHRKWILEVLKKHPLSAGSLEPRRHCRAFFLWAAAKLAKGECVYMPGLGKLHATFRKGRTIRTTIRGKTVVSVQPDQYVLKIKPANPLKLMLQELAATNPDPKTVFKAPHREDKAENEPSEV